MPSLPKHDPLALKKVTRERVNEIRDRLELAPIEVEGVLVDCDEVSEKRMKNHIEFWDGVVGPGSVKWMMADNQDAVFTRSEFSEFFAKVMLSRTIRSSLLHVKAADFKLALPNLTERDIHPEQWC